ncbi:pyridoxal phosphate-dependent aminotransferase [Marinobacterium marinum]|uniref:Aminotransferase n=1 Tax=Marinobacterium marinum TaxID=2756129 RepID=A0A7W1WZM9_9GAMM|nr:pyridoxal phosphate-dependent aminotransferase [Marinobacterium marinum]MBA4503178.1 pyridoxal phosphate-dependent aminotransferase [Marinobacterium marinum]
MSIDAYLRPINHSETLLINERSSRLAVDRKIHRFGFGQSPFPVPAGVVAALQRHASEKAYLPVQGLAELRAAVADFHRCQDGVDWQPERVLIGPGSKLLIYAVMAAFTRAEVLLVSPSWVSYEPQAHLAGHRVSRLQACAEDDWRLTPAMLERFCRTRANPEWPLLLVLNYPGNPSGTTYSEDQLQALAEVMRRYQVLVISDEIYGVLHHQGAHRSLARYYPEGTLVTGGLSKWCGAGGWRLGVLQLPESLVHNLLPRLLGVASETWSCVAAPVQQAAIEAYRFGPEVAHYVQRERQVLATLGQAAAARLNEAGVTTAAPEGGFYLFPDFAPWRESLARVGIQTSDQLCRRLLEEAGVALLPGSAFGMPDSELVARLSYVDFDGAAALSAEAQALPEIFQPVMDGLSALLNWLRTQTRSVA